MKYDYQYKITFSLNEPFDINYIKNICNQYPNYKILVEVQNTKGISSYMIKQLSPNVAIRIAGGYDKERMSRYGSDLQWSSNYYNDAVIYTRNETIKILEEIEKIESGLSRNWSDIQKLLYIYDRLKTHLMYDPKFENKLSSEIRSLRGLITKQTVCAGYAMILKEFMDRNNIDCEYVEGHTKIDSNGQRINGHAWNIVNIGGKKYPIDLTWDNTTFRSGKSNSFDWLGKDIIAFCKNHYPAPGEKTQDYKHTLSQIDPQLINQIYSQMGIGRARDYSSTTYYGVRDDGSRYIVAQIGDTTINDINYYRYYYVDVLKDGKMSLPIILYSTDNLTKFINYKNFGRPKERDYQNKDLYNQKLKAFHEKVKKIDYLIDSVLFSSENILDSLSKKTFYIGSIKKDLKTNVTQYVSSYKEVSKPETVKNLFAYPTKRYKRSDGSIFIAQKMTDKPHLVNGINIYRFDIFEMVNENGKEVLKRNTVFTEKDFFKDNRQSMIDDYLSRSRLDRKVNEAGGYIGYYDENGIRTYNPNLVKFFETSKKFDLNILNNKSEQTTTKFQIPSFSELKYLTEKYEIFIDSSNPFDSDISKIKIRDIKTGQIQTNKSIIDKAIFANIWLKSAGIKYYFDESRPGVNYAFNEQAEELYNTICRQLLYSVKDKGVINTKNLFENIDTFNNYKYNKEVIMNLFRTKYQTDFINRLFLESLGIKQISKQAQPFYSFYNSNNLESVKANSR